MITGKPSKRQIGDKQKSILFGIFIRKFPVQNTNKTLDNSPKENHVTYQQSPLDPNTRGQQTGR